MAKKLTAATRLPKYVVKPLGAGPGKTVQIGKKIVAIIPDMTPEAEDLIRLFDIGLPKMVEALHLLHQDATQALDGHWDVSGVGQPLTEDSSCAFMASQDVAQKALASVGLDPEPYKKGKGRRG